mgnify:CR=1 FL=1
MIDLGPNVRVYAYGAAVDMRKGFEALWGLAQRVSERALSGELFLFVGRDLRRAKVLYFDGTGLCLLHKRLEQGRFACLWKAPQRGVLTMSRTELQLFLEGCSLVGKAPLSPPPLSSCALRTRRRTATSF